MREQIKSVRIFLFYFHLYLKIGHFSTILTKKVFLVTLKAKYQNDPNKVKNAICFKYFLARLKEHTVGKQTKVRLILTYMNHISPTYRFVPDLHQIFDH